MWVPHMKRDVELSNAFLTFLEPSEAQDCIACLNGKVCHAVSPTVMKVDCFLVRVCVSACVRLSFVISVSYVYDI